MDASEWSKQYVVFAVSRLDLQHSLGFSHEEVIKLTDHDMQRIADDVRKGYNYLTDDFAETVRFVTSVVLSEKNNAGNRKTGEQHER